MKDEKSISGSGTGCGIPSCRAFSSVPSAVPPGAPSVFSPSFLAVSSGWKHSPVPDGKPFFFLAAFHVPSLKPVMSDECWGMTFKIDFPSLLFAFPNALFLDHVPPGVQDPLDHRQVGAHRQNPDYNRHERRDGRPQKEQQDSLRPFHDPHIARGTSVSAWARV